MPTILFHELIGYKFAKKHKEFDTPNFYLGLIVPDSVNAYGFASKEKRWPAHLREKSLEKWQENIIDFYKSNEKNFEKCYLTGYVVHVLTDILCDKVYQQELYPNLIKEGFNYDTAYSFYKEGIDKLENSNINSTWWEYTKKSFQAGEIRKINEITVDMIEDWIENVLNQYKERKFEEVGYITDVFVENVLEKLEGILKKEKIIN